MSVLTRLRFGLARLALKASAFSIVPEWVSESILMPSFRSLVNEGYTKNAAFFACVSALSFGAGEAPLAMYAGEKKLERHPTLKLLKKPNALMSQAEFQTIILTYMAIGGNAYGHKVRNGGGRVVEIWPYHAGQFSPVPGGGGWISHYTYDDGSGTLQRVEAADVLHWKWPSVDPAQPWMAMPPLRAAASEVDADNEASRYLRALLQNDAVPRTIISQSTTRFMNDDEVRRAKAQFADRYGGDNRGGVLILEAGATVNRLSLNLEEMAFEAMHNIPEARIASVMRVPPIIAGLNVGLNRSTFSNYEEARKTFTQDTRVPLWNIIAGEIDADPDLNPDSELTVRHDLSRVAALQEDENNKWTRVISGFNAGLMSEEAAQGLLNLPLYQMPALPTVRDVTPAALPAPAKGASGRGETKARGIARALQRVRSDVAKRMEVSLDDYFGDLAERVVARATKAWRPGLEQKDLPLAGALLTVGDEKLLGDLVGDAYIEVIRASWETWNLALGTDIAFGIDDPAVVEALGLVGDQIRGIQDTTLASVRQLLQYGNEQGWTIDDLVAGDDERPGLRSLVEQTYKGRAKAIARTELGTAQNQATISRYETAGVGQVKILDGNGPNSCQECTDLNGATKDLDWARDNRLQHPNCIRAFAPVFAD